MAKQRMPCEHRLILALAALAGLLPPAPASAQDGEQRNDIRPLAEIVVSASRAAQSRFDAPAAITSVTVDAFHSAAPLVNLSEVLGSVPGLQLRERQNYAQDLQISVRGFGTRSTFGVRGVRILVDGIPATMPDGQGQAATASLQSAERIEVLRGPAAQLYGNAAGGVLQVFTKTPRAGEFTGGAGLAGGSFGQRLATTNIAGANESIAASIEASRFQTDGYRQHSAAQRSQANAKLVLRPAADSSLTLLFNYFDQPLSQDPLGLSRADYERDPVGAVAGALSFDTRKTIAQQQAGLLFEQRLSPADTLNVRLYGGTRQVFQTLALSGAAASSSGGVVDLDRDYGGIGAHWTRNSAAGLGWTIGVEADRLRETRRGFVNNAGIPGELRRNENDRAQNLDIFGQLEWRLSEQWRLNAGLRHSSVRLAVDDRFITAASPDDSGRTDFHQSSPVAGLLWHAADELNIYANLGRGFETPTLAESAYRSGGTGPNLALRASASLQGELGLKWRRGTKALELAAFASRSRDEIVPAETVNGRSIFQNVNGVARRGVEAAWQNKWQRSALSINYTWLDARFREAFSNAGGMVAAGNRLPGSAAHSLAAEAQYAFSDAVNAGLELRGESRIFVNDQNADAASGYATVNARGSYAFRSGTLKWLAWLRVDNLLDRRYAGSVIVNDGNARFFEGAPGRRLMLGLRTAL